MVCTSISMALLPTTSTWFADPAGAIQYVLEEITKYASELDDISAFCAFSSSAGVYDVTRAKLHVWFWLVRPYSNAELKHWGARSTRERATS